MHLRELTRCRATADDLELLFTITKRALREHVLATFESWNETEQKEIFFRCAVPSEMDLFLDQLAAIGYVWVERSIDDITLRQLAIMPEYQGNGLGTSMIRELISEAAISSIPVRLRVFKTNRARKLYRLLGFREERRSEHHIHMIYRS